MDDEKVPVILSKPEFWTDDADFIRLIHAAPDLLAALKEVVEKFPNAAHLPSVASALKKASA